MTNDNLLERIRSGDQRIVAELYEAHRDPFFRFGKTFSLDDDMVVEIYQDTMVVFYENVVFGKLTVLNSSVKTYIFSIGKHKIHEQLRHAKKVVAMADDFEPMADEAIDNEQAVLDDQAKRYKGAFLQLGPKCQRILELFYLQGKKIRQIVEEEHYENENTVKAQKSRCLKKLRELVKK